MRRRTNGMVVGLTALWFATSAAALIVVADYGGEVGRAGDAPALWPSDPLLDMERSGERATVVLFAHPMCPCTRATLAELESVTNRLHGLFDLHVLFFEPSDTSSMPDVWAASALREQASRLPGAILHTDTDGQLARHFGAYTSGQVLLYGTDGALRFAGGITPSRGHTGSNAGRSRLIAGILGDEGIDPLAPVTHPVFGCGLHDRAAESDKDADTDSIGGRLAINASLASIPSTATSFSDSDPYPGSAPDGLLSTATGAIPR